MCFTVQLSMCCLVFSLSFFASARDMLAHRQMAVNLFFYFLQILFWRKRRRGDLNPRIALAIYTLSRGASSATWVLLHVRNANVNGGSRWHARYPPSVGAVMQRGAAGQLRPARLFLFNKKKRTLTRALAYYNWGHLPCQSQFSL